MNINLDDDISKAALAARLRRAGHQVMLPANAGMSGTSDARHLLFAVQQKLILITKNHDDYEDLHFLIQGTYGQHPGILTVRAHFVFPALCLASLQEPTDLVEGVRRLTAM
jgi:hypothetical protein